MLKVNKLNVFYGDMQVLHEISLTVNEGEIVTVVGSNGAGKTTLLNTISGLLHPMSGSIEFFNERIDRIPAHLIVKKGITHIPEGRELFPDMTVLENLLLGSYTSEAKKLRKESLKWVFELFPVLEERKNQLAGTLSGGEQQMLAIARGLMSRPKLLMLDEPSLGLAPVIVLKIFEVIKNVNEQGLTILLVEQNVRFALAMSHRAYVLENGRIVLKGKGKDLLEDRHVRKAYLGL